MAKISQNKSAHLQQDHHFLVKHVRHSPYTPDTANTSDSDTVTQFPSDSAVLLFSGSGIGWLTMDKSRLILSSVDLWFIYERRRWEMDMYFDRRALMGKRSVHFLIRGLPDRSIKGDADAHQWTKIGGDGDRWCLFQIPDINIHLSTDQYINRSTKWREGHISKKVDNRTHWQDR